MHRPKGTRQVPRCAILPSRPARVTPLLRVRSCRSGARSAVGGVTLSPAALPCLLDRDLPLPAPADCLSLSQEPALGLFCGGPHRSALVWTIPPIAALRAAPRKAGLDFGIRLPTRHRRRPHDLKQSPVALSTLAPRRFRTPVIDSQHRRLTVLPTQLGQIPLELFLGGGRIRGQVAPAQVAHQFLVRGGDLCLPLTISRRALLFLACHPPARA